ncbi:hypothetical protein BofuT4_uP062150.1 [Botrytis cinerea T4]|jgi:hypothetical protein|uniref:Uncharacterized protein n=1 Tax=Botryotinia fuckeliana (strain T4) TaxID=999810 RepID=G2XU35_BOTF4|nr:hypothetical protein BofuT4_uP062150.1 [Botrytis cinerea T4]
MERPAKIRGSTERVGSGKAEGRKERGRLEGNGTEKTAVWVRKKLKSSRLMRCTRQTGRIILGCHFGIGALIMCMMCMMD